MRLAKALGFRVAARIPAGLKKGMYVGTIKSLAIDKNRNHYYFLKWYFRGGRSVLSDRHLAHVFDVYNDSVKSNAITT
jgi:hypothetical protein